MPWWRLQTLPRSRQLRLAGIAALILLATIGLTRLLEFAVLSADRDRFETVLEAQCREYLSTAEREFVSVQRTTRRVATEVAGNPTVLTALQGTDTSRIPLFDAVVKMARDQDVGIEVYDRKATLLAWEGRSGTHHRREILIALDGQMTSYVNRAPIASQLFVTIPVRDRGRIIGAVLVRRTIDVNYPLSNRYIQREGLTRELTRRLGVTVEFNFSPGAELRKDGRYASTILYGIDSSRVGTVSVLRPARYAFLESIALPFRTIETVLLAALLGVAVLVLWNVVDRSTVHPVLRFVGALAIIWGARYALLWIDIGSIIPATSLFDPALFASQFGRGIARSLGEMTISVVALVCSVAYGVALFSGARSKDLPAGRFPQNLLLRISVSAVTVLLFYWILRGFAAVVRSVVFDSTLRFADPRELMPSFELAVMIVNLLVTACCVVVVGTAVLWFVLRSLAGGRAPGTTTWIAASILLVVFAWVFGALQETELMPSPYRAAFGLILVLVAARISRTGEVRLISDARTALMVLAAAVILYYPLVDLNVREKDRDQIEMFADEVSRPGNGWLRFVVEDGLRTLASDETADVLLNGDPEEVNRLAFLRWGQSLACRGGYTALFAITDSTGRELSRFFIGGQIQRVLAADKQSPAGWKDTVRIVQTGSGIEGSRIYAGTTPIRGTDGKLLGFGRVLVAGGQQALFRDENTALLRSTGPEDLRSFYRPVSVSEFLDGVVQATNNAAVPVGYRVPDTVTTAFKDSLVSSLWVNEEIDGRPYETYYLRHPGGGEIIALGLKKPKPLWHVVALVKLVSFITVLVLIVAAVSLIVRRLRRLPVMETFRDRLFAALLITALVPLALLTIYGQFYEQDRMVATATARLSDYTMAVAQNVPEERDSLLRAGVAVPYTTAEQLASDVGSDFVLYVGNELALTSRPELFEAGILDRRMSGRAYSNVVLRGKRFFVETERIGAYEYAVGYRPIVADDGSIIATVSVPTLFRPDDLETDVSGRNAFVLGVYLLVLGVIFVIATTLASRIAAPVHRLTEATQRVALGDLNVRLAGLHAQGEIGQLIRSFESMTADLHRNRQTLLRAERELAWKEMARQVAHEIKNPLTPMRLAVQHLRMVFREGGADFGQVLDEVTQTLLKQIDTLSRIASEFSHFARMPNPQLVQCDVNEIVNESVQLFDRFENVRFVVGLEPELPRILADKDELRRAFINILRNAIQAMNSEGTVTVRTRNDTPLVEVTIHDTGPGIPEEIRERLFQPNFSTKTEGMGLGLAIVKKTIDDLGGTISIGSMPGEGTTVVMRIPQSFPESRDNGNGV